MTLALLILEAHSDRHTHGSRDHKVNAYAICSNIERIQCSFGRKQRYTYQFYPIIRSLLNKSLVFIGQSVKSGALILGRLLFALLHHISDRLTQINDLLRIAVAGCGILRLKHLVRSFKFIFFQLCCCSNGNICVETLVNISGHLIICNVRENPCCFPDCSAACRKLDHYLCLENSGHLNMNLAVAAAFFQIKAVF